MRPMGSPHSLAVVEHARSVRLAKADTLIDTTFNRHLASVAKEVKHTLDYMSGHPELEDLLNAWSSGDFKDWDHKLAKAAKAVRVNPKRLAGALQSAYLDGSFVPNASSLRPMEWDPKAITPQAVRYASAKAGNLIKGMSDTMRANVHRYVLQTVQGDMDAKELRRVLSYSIKMDERSAQAVERFRENLLRAGSSKADANKQARAYAQRLIDGRAETIARTETMTAMNAGIREYWTHMVGMGQVPESSVQWRWETAGDDQECPVCKPMDGVTIPFDSSFVLSSGVIPYPPAHPRCRCTVSLDMPSLSTIMSSLPPL